MLSAADSDGEEGLHSASSAVAAAAEKTCRV